MHPRAKSERDAPSVPSQNDRFRFVASFSLVVVALLLIAGVVVPVSAAAPSRGPVTPEASATPAGLLAPILSFVATPNPSEVGVPSHLVVTVLGNVTLGDSFLFSGLPAGCTSESVSNLTCTPTEAGVFTVTVSITNLLGLVEGNLTWTVQAALSASITATATSTPLTAHFEGGVAGGVSLASVLWHFGDGTSASGSLSLNHTYLAAGTYNVTLELIDALGVLALATENVTLSPPVGTLVAVATDTTTTGNAPLTVKFEGSASGGVAPYSYAWTFGDGTSGTGSAPTHTYTAQGDFEAVLTVTDGASIAAQASVLVVVLPPVGILAASIATNVTGGPAPLSVSFHGSASGGSAPYVYLWIFGDGSASASGAAAVHTYTTTGSFEATLTVTDSTGSVTSSQVDVIVTAVSGSLVASASAIVTTGVAPFLASFSGSAHGGTAPYTFTWSFGDGSAEVNGSLVAHLYATAGTYLATLTVTDTSGNVTTAHAQVSVTSSVSGSLQATASTTVTSGVAPLTVNFHAGVAGGTAPFDYLWSFGDGAASTEAAPSFVYTAAGSYAAILVVTDATGATALSFVNVQVFATAPSLSVGAAARIVAASTTSETVAFTASASGGPGPYAYAWNFDDGSAASTATNPEHTFTSSGDFAVTLEVTDRTGRSSTYDLNLVVALSGLLVLSSGTASPGTSNLTWGFHAATAGGSGPYSYAWNFGDGSSVATGLAPVHAFAHSGTYIVTVTSTDSQGYQAVHEMVVNVPGSSPASSPVIPTLLLVAVAAVVGSLVAVLNFRRRQMVMRAAGRTRSRASGERTADVLLSADVILARESEELPGEKDALDDMF